MQIDKMASREINEFVIEFSDQEFEVFGKALVRRVQHTTFQTPMGEAMQNTWANMIHEEATGIYATLEESEMTAAMLRDYGFGAQADIESLDLDPGSVAVSSMQRRRNGYVALQMASKISATLAEEVVVNTEALADECTAYYLRQPAATPEI